MLVSSPCFDYLMPLASPPSVLFATANLSPSKRTTTSSNTCLVINRQLMIIMTPSNLPSLSGSPSLPFVLFCCYPAAKYSKMFTQLPYLLAVLVMLPQELAYVYSKAFVEPLMLPSHPRQSRPRQSPSQFPLLLSPNTPSAPIVSITPQPVITAQSPGLATVETVGFQVQTAPTASFFI